MVSRDELDERVRSLDAERARPDAKPPTVEDLIRQVIAVLAAALADEDATGKAERLAEYRQLREAGVKPADAAWRVGIGPETARRYEHEINSTGK